MKKTKPRKMMLCGYSNSPGPGAARFPVVRLRGEWLWKFGFEVGAQVTITNPKPSVLVMTVTKTSYEMKEERDAIERQVEAFEKKLKKSRRADQTSE